MKITSRKEPRKIGDTGVFDLEGLSRQRAIAIVNWYYDTAIHEQPTIKYDITYGAVRIVDNGDTEIHSDTYVTINTKTFWE